MVSKPFVSIIMNCFNGEKYLYEAIDSVISQNYENWELIFWDNVSTDSSAEILSKYNDKRVKYFLSDSHTLLSEARSLAIEKSEGEIITFLDVDDFWKDTILEKQVALYEDDDVIFTCGNFYIITEFSRRKKVFIKEKMPSGYVLNNLLKNYSVGMLTLSIKRTAYFEVGGFSWEYHIIGDMDLVFKLAINGKMASFNEPLAVCRKDGNNESILKVDLYIEELKVWYKKNSESFNNKNKDAVNVFYSDLLFKEYVNLINNSSFSFVSFLSALKKQPLLNVFKIIIKLFIKKFNGVRV
tara:strand:- start:3169 stop:4059 length:891 start_codon:yes stop_codon:yes gene_type:complete